MPSPACELRRFSDWRPDQVVRFCAEPDHRHEDGIATYDSEDIDSLLAWSAQAGVRRIPTALRIALLEVKATFGGRIDPTSVSTAASTPEDRR